MSLACYDEVRALIFLAYLSNSWELMRATVSNSVGKGKLQLNDARDQILAEEVRRIDSGESISSSSTLNLENKSSKKNSNWGRSRSKSRNDRDKSRSGRKLKC
ncbi:hypothetical protein PanWU01x14_148400 [Parasponia andersonii]|uniref:Uncharacterized protein n=1 Tax=Parasponia andersonii TaxID=3476 RepID=A0A2P5CJ61_PARAD|nr:hypothetical protein PanWU01x14_148400 [Parasponia andersonii]